MLNRRLRTEAQESASRAVLPSAFEITATKCLPRMILLKGESLTLSYTLDRKFSNRLDIQNHIKLICGGNSSTLYCREMRARSLEGASLAKLAAAPLVTPYRHLGLATEPSAAFAEQKLWSLLAEPPSAKPTTIGSAPAPLPLFKHHHRAQALRKKRFYTPTLGSDGKQSNSTRSNPED